MIAFENSTWEKTMSDIIFFSRVDARIYGILEEMAEAFRPYGHPLVITETEYKGGSGVHAALRAVDVRSRGLKDEDAEMIAADINFAHPRRDGKPTCLFHDIGKGPHFHIQVPPYENLQDI